MVVEALQKWLCENDWDCVYQEGPRFWLDFKDITYIVSLYDSLVQEAESVDITAVVNHGPTPAVYNIPYLDPFVDSITLSYSDPMLCLILDELTARSIREKSNGQRSRR